MGDHKQEDRRQEGLPQQPQPPPPPRTAGDADTQAREAKRPRLSQTAADAEAAVAAALRAVHSAVCVDALCVGGTRTGAGPSSAFDKAAVSRLLAVLEGRCAAAVRAQAADERWQRHAYAARHSGLVDEIVVALQAAQPLVFFVDSVVSLLRATGSVGGAVPPAAAAVAGFVVGKCDGGGMKGDAETVRKAVDRLRPFACCAPAPAVAEGVVGCPVQPARGGDGGGRGEVDVIDLG